MIYINTKKEYYIPRQKPFFRSKVWEGRDKDIYHEYGDMFQAKFSDIAYKFCDTSLSNIFAISKRLVRIEDSIYARREDVSAIKEQRILSLTPEGDWVKIRPTREELIMHLRYVDRFSSLTMYLERWKADGYDEEQWKDLYFHEKELEYNEDQLKKLGYLILNSD